ncbi:DNA (cytosine-5-)-methyltransferase [Candidatus Amesbacteria bacterium]|nr:DNA (cytosine-5-)-methyltransferase [Candidatus Amesbacteria bacterium]
MNNNLTVTEVAKKLSVSADTIRRWEKSGLIKSRRSENNYRLFNYNEAERVKKKLHGGSSSNGFKILKSTKKTNFNIIELFTGAGGTALGLENAGLVHELAVELDKNACETIRYNRPRWNLLEDDIRNIDFKPWKDKVDIIEGGFPCQSFSYAGKGMGFGETRGTLFFEFARAIQETMPKVAVGENVKGLLKHDQGRTLDTMLKKLNEIGYRVGYKVLRSQYLDVPQKRERLIIIAVRNDLSFPLLVPKEKDYYISIREALIGVPKSDGQKYPKRKSEILNLVPPGGYWKDLPLDIQKEYMGRSYYLGGGKTGMARRLSFDEPSLTLTCAPAQKQTERCHPIETRPLTVREYARIQTFPDEWDFSGSMSSKYRQIGNAVPVNLGYHIGKSLIAMLKNSPDLSTMEIIKPV